MIRLLGTLGVVMGIANMAHAAPQCTTDFVRSIGVVTHLDATATQYGNLGRVVAALNYLGIDRVRETAPRSPEALARLQALIDADDRVRLTLIVMGDPVRAMPAIDALAKHVDIVEGPNEVDRTPVHFRGLSGAEAVMAAQRWIYQTVHADPLLNGPGRYTPVLNFTLARADYTAYGDLSASADLANTHAYATRGVPPFFMVQPTVRKALSFLARPVIITEANYPTLRQADGNGVSEAVQARWVLNTQLDSARNGVVATYIYQLLDGVSDPNDQEYEAHFGLFRFDNSPKPSATALRNLITILRGTRPCPVQASPEPTYKVNLGHDSFDLLLARPDGTHVLLLWAEPIIWDPAQNIDKVSPPRNTTVRFGADRHDVSVYDPLLGPEPISRQAAAGEVSVTLTDHPILVAIH